MTKKYEMGRIAWHCRRGIKEVEVVLLPYFERFFEQGSEREKNLFLALLECQDPDLFEWFTYRSKPEDPEIAEIVELVLSRLGSGSSAS